MDETASLHPAYTTDPYLSVVSGCLHSVTWDANGAPPVATSQEELEERMGCDPGMVVDWSTEHIAMVSLMGTNTTFTFKGVSESEGIATIGIHSHYYIAGAPLDMEEVWLVRIPATTTQVVIDRTSSSDPPGDPKEPTPP